MYNKYIFVTAFTKSDATEHQFGISSYRLKKSFMQQSAWFKRCLR